MATIWKFNLQFDTQSHGFYSYPLPVIVYLWVKISVVRIAGESIGTETSGVKCSFCRAGVKKIRFQVEMQEACCSCVTHSCKLAKV